MTVGELFLVILNMSITGAFVVAAILLARLSLKRVPKIISYCLWAVAGFRFAFPFSITSMFSLIPFKAQTIPLDIVAQPVPYIESGISYVRDAINNTFNSAMNGSVTNAVGNTIGNAVTSTVGASVTNAVDANITSAVGASVTNSVGASITNAINNAASSTQNYAVAGDAVTGVNSLQTWTAIIPWTWFFVAAVMSIFGVAFYLRLKHKMRLAIRIKDNIYETDGIRSPFILGVIKPKIYVPLDLSEQERRYIILHEQTHIRRNDHIIKFASYLILCLHWFNPMAWIAFILMGLDMELSCDECVLNKLGDEISKDYSMSLLSYATDRSIIRGSALAFGEDGVKTRIKNVLKFKKSSRFAVALAIIFVATLSLGLMASRADNDNSLEPQAVDTTVEGDASTVLDPAVGDGDVAADAAVVSDAAVIGNASTVPDTVASGASEVNASSTVYDTSLSGVGEVNGSYVISASTLSEGVNAVDNTSKSDGTEVTHDTGTIDNLSKASNTNTVDDAVILNGADSFSDADEINDTTSNGSISEYTGNASGLSAKNVYNISEFYNNEDGKFSSLGLSLAEMKSERALTVGNGDVLVVGNQRYQVTTESLTLSFYTQPLHDQVIQWWIDYLDSWAESGKVSVVYPT